jgi:hypothetical protein
MRKTKYDQDSASKASYLNQDVGTFPVPAPVGGWNTLSPLANMEPQYAVNLDNFVPRPGWVELRGGFQVTNAAVASAPIETLMTYRPTNGTERLFAGSGSVIYEVSTPGAATIAKSALLGPARWQYVNMTVPGGSSYISVVNGTNPPLLFDGTVWTNPVITGVTTTPNNFILPILHMNRLWYVEKDSTRVWYLPTQAIAGAANVVDVGALLTKGGYVQSMGTWTVDGGNGPNALLVILSSKGQAVIYQGTDPANAAAFNLVGVYSLPSPIGRRCIRQIGSDLAIITIEGLIPISKALPFNPSSQRSTAFTNIIQTAVLNASQLYRQNFGWECALFPAQTLMILNIPTVENATEIQYVTNTITGAWCSFSGWNACTFETFNEKLYFGDPNGNVCQAYYGRLDGTANIVADCECAFNFFKEPGRLKNMTLVRPYLVVDGTVLPTISVEVDFSNNNQDAQAITIISPASQWDVSLWDQGLWGGVALPQANWQSVNTLGTALAIRMKINYGGALLGTSNADLPILQIVAFETVLQMGGPV